MKLLEAVNVRLGYPFRGKINALPGASVLAVQMKDISAKREISWANCTAVALEGKKAPEWLEVGDILLATRGNTNYAVLIDSPPPEGLKAVATPHFYVLRPKQQLLRSEFLHWWLNQRPCQQHFETQAEGSVTKSIRRAVVEQVPLVVPPVEDQQAVIGLSTNLKQQSELLQKQLTKNQSLQNTIAGDLLTRY